MMSALPAKDPIVAMYCILSNAEWCFECTLQICKVSLCTHGKQLSDVVLAVLH